MLKNRLLVLGLVAGLCLGAGLGCGDDKGPKADTKGAEFKERPPPVSPGAGPAPKGSKGAASSQ
jgi:hypothetical protein